MVSHSWWSHPSKNCRVPIVSRSSSKWRYLSPSMGCRRLLLRHVFRYVIMLLIRSGSVSSLWRALCKLEIEFVQISETVLDWHFQACHASWNWLQWGQAAVSLILHNFWNLPTPHIPEVCFEQKNLLGNGILSSAQPSLGQRTEEKLSSLIRDFCIQYCLTMGVCTKSYNVWSMSCRIGIEPSGIKFFLSLA